MKTLLIIAALAVPLIIAALAVSPVYTARPVMTETVYSTTGVQPDRIGEIYRPGQWISPMEARPRRLRQLRGED
jgi:hypothetical protein